MRVRAFKFDDLTAHHYGDGRIVLFQDKPDRVGMFTAVTFDAKQLHKRLGKFIKKRKRSKHAR